MARYLSNRDGGKTDEAGHLRFLQSLTSGDVFSGGEVTQNDTPNMTVKVAAVDALIRDTGNKYAYHAWSDATENVSIATANSGNPRKDYIIAYVDRGETPDDTDPNNPAIWKLISVAGTPAGSPVVPTVSQIQASDVGMNPYIILATVTVAASTTTITNASIDNSKKKAVVPAKRLEKSSHTIIHTFSNATGEQIITGVPFAPNSIRTQGTVNVSGGANSSGGFAQKNGASTDQAAQSSVTGGTEFSIIRAFLSSSTGSGAVIFAANVTGWNEDGITVNVAVSTATASARTFIIEFKP